MVTEEQFETLISRVNAIEDRAAIRRLRYDFSTYIDARDWERFETLFVSDSTVEFPETDRPSITGMDGIREWCDDIEDGYTFTYHMVHHPRIDIDGEHASGMWYFETATETSDTAELALGMYEDEYVRVDGDWKFETIRVRFRSTVECPSRWVG